MEIEILTEDPTLETFRQICELVKNQKTFKNLNNERKNSWLYAILTEINGTSEKTLLAL
jgi:hypothetical protein